MDTVIVEMDETEQQLMDLFASVTHEDNGWTGPEIQKILNISQYKREKLIAEAVDRGLLIVYTGKRKYRNGVINIKTLYMLNNHASIT